MCGKPGSNTKDHIPPKNFFSQSMRHNMQLLTVPAHLKCNSFFQVEDEDFRNIVLKISTNNPNARSYWNSHIASSFIRNPGAKTRLNKNIKPIWVKRPHELGLIRMDALHLDVDFVTRHISRWYKGIYYKNHNKPYPLDKKIVVEIIRSDYDYISSFHSNLRELGLAPHWKIIIPKVFAYLYFDAEDNREEGICYFLFYNGLIFTATTEGLLED